MIDTSTLLGPRPPIQAVILAALHKLANEQGICQASLRELSHATEYSERSVVRAIKDLAQCQLVIVEHRHEANGTPICNSYSLAPLAETDPPPYRVDLRALPPLQTVVLDALHQLSNPRGVCYASLCELSAETGYSRRSIRRAIKDLIMRRMVEVFQRHEKDGSQLSNQYSLISGGS